MVVYSSTMKLPQIVSQLLHKNPERKDVFLSLILDVGAVHGAVWDFVEKKKPKVEFSSTEPVKEDNWVERIQSCDKVLMKLEDQLPPDVKLTNVVLGLPPVYLTKEGDIDTAIRVEIKKLTKELELNPIGFVSLPQALVHKFKVDEGVPPSLILLGLSASTMSLDLYKVGALMGQKNIKFSENDIVSNLEDTLKSFTELEVLPSRIMLYGDNSQQLESVRQQLLKHPWPTRVNFLHFPKIEILSQDDPIVATCLAGASEIATQMGEELAIEEASIQEDTLPKETHTVVQTPNYTAPVKGPEEVIEEESNVVEVDPESLGFTKTAAIEATPSDIKEEEEIEEEEEKAEEEELMTKEDEEPEDMEKMPIPISNSKKVEDITPASKGIFARLPKATIRSLLVSSPKKKLLFIMVPVLIFVILIGAYFFLPQAEVKILTLPEALVASSTVTINPAATVADASSNIIPAKKQEQSISGEKTIPVTGKKQIGDPAKGEASIYNKSLSGKSFKKGTFLTSGSLQFTLDSDVSVASASESIGSITFGKANVSITAGSIGAQSNLPAGTEFTFKDFSSSIAIARNDKALSGGTSRDVTVVSRADYDALVASLSEELVGKAKTQLSASVGGGEKLIDSTVKTTVTEKKFTEELDQQAKELHGKITITVSGMSYSENDITALLQESIDAKVPNGYTVNKDQATVDIGTVTVKKDGTAVVSATLTEQAQPVLDISKIKSSLAGKSIDQAKELLRGMEGIAGVEFSFHRSLWKDTLPIRPQNITVTQTTQE